MYAWLVEKNAVSFCGMEKNIFLVASGYYSEPVSSDQVPVVQKVDSAIHRINHYPVDKY